MKINTTSDAFTTAIVSATMMLRGPRSTNAAPTVAAVRAINTAKMP